MRYYVTLGGPEPGAQVAVVDVTLEPGGAPRATVDGRLVAVDATSLGKGLNVLVDGRVVDLTTDGIAPELGAIASGLRAVVRVENERMRTAEQAKRSGAVSHERVVKSPMPGRVVKVLVAKGDSVLPGQALVVLEAMKMENEVRARAAGTVGEVHVAPGAPVEGNARLVTFV